MDVAVIAQFAFATLLPVVACVLLTALRKTPRVAQMPEASWQVLVGIVFGAIAIFGTEAGIPLDGAMMNVRDAAPLTAGLFFGGPAGIIAGVIGGVERWFAVYWGVGEFTRLACSLGTIIAGLFAAVLRKHLFDLRLPTWPMALAAGALAEVMHLMLVIVTNLDRFEAAVDITLTCVAPMVSCVAISTMLSAIVMARLHHQPLIPPREERGVAQIIQSRLLLVVFVALVASVAFAVVAETSSYGSEIEETLRVNVNDVEQSIREISDKNLVSITHKVASSIGTVDGATDDGCREAASMFDVAEVNVVNASGIIVATSNPDFVGFDMASGEQSAEFLQLLQGAAGDEFVQDYQPMTYDSDVWRKYAGVAIEGGFVQVGYDAETFSNDLAERIVDAVKHRHVGLVGELATIDKNGQVITSRVDSSGVSPQALLDSVNSVEEGDLFTTAISGEEYYGIAGTVEGYTIIALMPVKELTGTRDTLLLLMSFMEILVLSALFAVMYFVIKKVVVSSIWQVNERLGEITGGDLDVEVDVHSSAEFSSLSADINKTVGALKESIAAVKSDLDMAADLQANTLPKITPEISSYREFELYATMKPATEVGGDFYDFFLVDDDHMALVVADVSGKGVAAALFMMRSKTTIKMEALSGYSPAEVLYRVNKDLAEKNDDDMFTTAWLGILEISTGQLVYADAGHEKLAIYHDGAWDLPDKPNRAVSLASFDAEDYELLKDNYRYRDHTIVLAPGDAIFQYTDGVTEATNADDELFGEERMVEALGDAASAAPHDVLSAVRDHVAGFVLDAPQFDDMTMLGLLYKGA